MQKTTAQIYNELQDDPTKYNSMEIAEAASESIEAQVRKSIQKGLKKFSDDLFSIVMMSKKDRNLPFMVKRLFTETPFLPKPAPDQAVWVYNRKTDKLTFMWSLPNPHLCALLSVSNNVDKKWENTALWCRLFFEGKLHHYIRAKNNIKIETEKEFKYLHREELLKMFNDHRESLITDALNQSEVGVDGIPDSKDIVVE
jgi:hypothetical protein